MPSRKDDVPIYQEKSLLNAAIIGFMVGTYEVMGRGATQAVVNMAGRYVGKEVMQYARDKGIEITSEEDFVRFAKEEGLAGQLEFLRDATGTTAHISECGTCPKKVGHF